MDPRLLHQAGFVQRCFQHTALFALMNHDSTDVISSRETTRNTSCIDAQGHVALTQHNQPTIEMLLCEAKLVPHALPYLAVPPVPVASGYARPKLIPQHPASASLIVDHVVNGSPSSSPPKLCTSFVHWGNVSHTVRSISSQAIVK